MNCVNCAEQIGLALSRGVSAARTQVPLDPRVGV